MTEPIRSTTASPEEVEITPEQAAAELLRRRRARESLEDYARAIDVPGAPVNEQDPECEVFKAVETPLADHHALICREVQACIEKPNGRLMVFAPPGSAKSSYVSVVASVWAMKRYENYRVILTSYASDIAWKQSRRARQLARDPRENAIWSTPAQLAGDQRAVEEWALTNGSEFMAAGLLAGVTGNRADLLIVDDPVKNQTDADSPRIQQRTIEEFHSTADSRLKPNGSIVVVQTRWNENDLSGQILPEDWNGQSGDILCRDGQVWRVVNMPAKAEHADDPLGRQIGEYLWTEWFPPKHWELRENNPRAKRTWAALFQQRPKSADGIDFERAWFIPYDPDIAPGLPGGRPANLTLYGASDYASKEPIEGEKVDFTEHGIAGIDNVYHMWLLDWWYGQKNSDVYIQAWIAMLRRWPGCRRWWHEGGPIGNAILPAMNQAMRTSGGTNGVGRVYVPLEALTSIQNKTVKLASFQAMAAGFTVHYPLRRPWADRVIDQLLAFPGGRYDDAADVCGLLGRGIDKMMKGNVPSAQTRKPGLIPFTQEWLEYSENTRPKIRYT